MMKDENIQNDRNILNSPALLITQPNRKRLRKQYKCMI